MLGAMQTTVDLPAPAVSRLVELGVRDLRKESDRVALRLRAAEHVGSHLWLPQRLEHRMLFRAKIVEGCS
jgi:hypothetical protein